MAIAFVGSADLGNNGGTTNSLTTSYTVGSGVGRLLVVLIEGDVANANDDITSVTYAGVGMTLAVKNVQTGFSGFLRFDYIYYLLTPASGANNVVINCTNNHFLAALAGDYTGVAALDATQVGTPVTATSLTTSITTVADNSWAILMEQHDDTSADTSAGAGATLRVAGVAFKQPALLDSNAPITPAGSNSLTTTTTLAVGPVHASHTIASFLPLPPGITCVEAYNFLARTSGLNVTHTNAYNNLICGLVTDGVWSKLDAFYVFYTQTSTTANLNLVSSSFGITPHGAPNFLADQGYMGVDSSTTVYLDTGMNAATAGGNFVQNSAHISMWSLTNYLSVGNGATTIGVDDGTNFSQIVPWLDNGSGYGAANSLGAQQAHGAVSDSLGFYVGNRSGINSAQVYKNASVLATNTAGSGSVTSATFFVCARNSTVNGAEVGSAHRIAMASIGSSLTQTDVTNFYGRFNTYTSDLAAPQPLQIDMGITGEARSNVQTGVGQHTIWWRQN